MKSLPSEKSERSLVKTISYRILIVISTFVVTYLLTREIKLTIEITAIANIINTILYFLHERFWNKIRWGKSK